ncbi:HEAT repeat domain-containing protein [Candidatus Nitronereus thalassa]|uniref:HEAT repeat domain-containing protein n=1 Tax=Candidatus Nitronereus thalassa TaxID=3020898 RepID=A0ABU3K3X7_9BACT|nr:HEAT repeat domain-containing protein [Candidatus Nitronereus thalassa]MDT7041089.1 HEAT repeat domain-containing protein [Candidatus Nitronereus thalassa]
MLKSILPRFNFLVGVRALIVFLTCLLWWVASSWALAKVQHLADVEGFSKARGSQSIYVNARVSTWKTRGVMFWDVEGSLLVKLRDVGFTIVRNSTDSHDLTLTVDYAETKGQAFAINRFGTEIEGTFLISHQTAGPLFSIHIQETSVPMVTGTPPYIDVLLNFLTNPYYHYLGEIVRGEIQGSQDPHQILIDSLLADVTRLQNTQKPDSVMDHSRRPQHSVPIDKNQYAPVAAYRAIDELVAANEVRLVEILKSMVMYPDVHVQMRSIDAFGDFRVTEALPFLRQLSLETQQVEVRDAALNTMNVLASFSE